ncbi:LytTR family transcriptional regulator [Spirosoma sp. HMF3257]|uniref:LytTR family transcriptional regulator n=1 Tax=Spirosoma telluris TaxID=2183553 RepID=A0A327NKC6_9BACT|nr:LytTR family transcriptional regulator [Spirosoma telluris]RAI75821.1 LytTR family transcriptional regulator [Spirosoma telluris]
MSPLTRQQHIIFLVTAIPMAALVASHVVFSQVFPGQPGYQFPWAYFLTVATVMFSCWQVNLFIFHWLDTRLPFWENPTRRLIAQILVGGFATLVTFAFVFPLAQRVYIHHWPPMFIILRGVIVCITLATLVNGGYSGLYILQAFFSERQKRAAPVLVDFPAEPLKHVSLTASTSLVSIDVSTGQVRLPANEIAYFYSTGGLVLVVKADGQQLTTRYSSFSQLTSGLDNHYFFQLSRQFIVGLGAVRAVQDDVNRKLVVTLVPALHKQQAKQEVIVSRYRSLELKKWLQASAVP